MQQTNLYTITIPPMIKALDGLSKILGKCKAVIEPKVSEWQPYEEFEEAFLNDRLIFDMFPLIRQIQVASDNAKGGAARLAEIEIPKFEDTEKTINDLKQRIKKTTDFLKKIKPDQVIGKESVKVKLPYWEDKHMLAFDYVHEYLIPNFFFHITTAYGIIRKNGVEIGKEDYINGLSLKQDN